MTYDHHIITTNRYARAEAQHGVDTGDEFAAWYWGQLARRCTIPLERYRTGRAGQEARQTRAATQDLPDRYRDIQRGMAVRAEMYWVMACLRSWRAA